MPFKTNKRQLRKPILRAATWIAVASAALSARADDLGLLEEQAAQEAADRVSDSVVHIRTVGGLDEVGTAATTFGGLTTGLIIGMDGWIVSSAAAFENHPASILVTLPQGGPAPAEIIATDHSRQFVLLKVTAERDLAVPIAVPESEIHPGAWAIAMGRTYSADVTNVSVGIVSARGRMQGRALQTDAKVSPTNYGGPLIDIRGRVLGLLVPMTSSSPAHPGGGQWYDAGIGFAVPLEQILTVLPRLQRGEDLHRGVMGISLQPGNAFTTPNGVASVHPNSPAAKAGLRVDDRIVEVDQRRVESQIQLRGQLGRHYAGDTVRVATLRAGARIELQIQLVEKLTPFKHPFLGLLPMRSGIEAEPDGLVVRYVYPDSPAHEAGIKDGDQIVSLNDKPVQNAQEALAVMNTLQSGATVSIGLRRSDDSMEIDLVATELPTAIPDSLQAEAPAPHDTTDSDPPPTETKTDEATERDVPDAPKTGMLPWKLAEFENESTVYIPDNYDPRVPHGLVLWLPAPDDKSLTETVRRWKPWCDRTHLILVAPRPRDDKRWDRGEVDFLRKLVDSVRQSYPTDATRIVVHGYQAGGVVAYMLGMNHRDLFRAIAVVDASFPSRFTVPPVEPVQRIAIYTSEFEASPLQPRIRLSIERLKAQEYPVTARPLGDQPRYLNDGELEQLVRWIDSLDRI